MNFSSILLLIFLTQLNNLHYFGNFQSRIVILQLNTLALNTVITTPKSIQPQMNVANVLAGLIIVMVLLGVITLWLSLVVLAMLFIFQTKMRITNTLDQH